MPVPLHTLASLMEPLRGFVAVGRRMSITAAAEELCLTQSAISRQVQALEERLGVKLLVRGHRAIAFTPEGEQLFRSASTALAQIQDTVAVIRQTGRRIPVTLSTTIGVAGLWLLPRLGRFQARYPDIDVRVATHNRLQDLAGEGIDLAIRYSPPPETAELPELLFKEEVAPVAHASLQARSLMTREDIARHVLLEFDDPGRPWLHWRDWLDAAGWRGVEPKGMLRFNQYDQVVQAALAGQGIALGRLALIRPLVPAQLLVLPTVLDCPEHRHAYWLLRAEPEPRVDVAALAEWIVEQAEA